MMAAIVKALLLVAATGLFQSASSPPTKPAEASERAKFGAASSDLLSRARILAFAGHGILWTKTLCECAVLLAKNLPWPYAKLVLRNLVGNGYDAANVRMTNTWLIGWSLVVGGSILRIAAHQALGNFFTWELSVRKEHALVTSGPYALVRHPAYTGIWLAVTGGVMMWLGSGSWSRECGWSDTMISQTHFVLWVGSALFLPFLVAPRTIKEDAVLKEEFGDQWTAYAKKTSYRLIPFVF